MATQSGFDSLHKPEPKSVRGGGNGGNTRHDVDQFVPRTDHNPRELRSWAKQTGFVSDFSGETSNRASEKFNSIGSGNREGGLSPKTQIDPVLRRTRPNGEVEIEPVMDSGSGNGVKKNELGEEVNQKTHEPLLRQNSVEQNRNGNEIPLVTETNNDSGKAEDIENRFYPGKTEEPDGGGDWHRQQSGIKLRIRDNPGFVPLIYYGVQHYISLAGSLVFIPLIIVPAMGGTDKDTATVISTMLFISGVTTILHSYLGTRLPLVQGSSFVYLAPALVVINSQEYRNLTEHKFRYIMRELQGAILVGSIFQSILGLSGVMSFLLRLINPVVVAPTVAAVGLTFFSYGFPQAGSCVEISVPQIVLVLIFTLYLRGISIYGHRLFRIYAVPLSIMIVWTFAFFLTAGGVYNYKSCSPDIPTSNILIDECRKHAYTMKHCRTDVSNAWRTAAWVRIPYPFQWGIPTFHLRTSVIMIFVSLVASVDSIGTYHSTSVLVNSKPPTPGIVSRGIALEGLCSGLAGVWGSGTGATTLTENIHTIYTTKVASRRAVQLGAVFLILFSFVGKVGAILASIPQALAASVLCFTWALIVALGLSVLQYTKTSSFRNLIVVAVSLFLGFSIPAYFQQYQSETNIILPNYFVPYGAASDGPVNTGSKQLDFALNAVLSMNMVVTLLLAFVLDNTVPGGREERGVYLWSRAQDMAIDPDMQADYSLPRKISKFLCCCCRCLGA